MKNYYEILEEIKTTHEELNKVTEETKKETDRFCDMEFSEMKEYVKTPEYKAEKEVRTYKLAELGKRQEELKMILAFLKNNLKQSLYAEMLPVIIETMQKYKGKPLGDKTKDKIYNEVKDKTNCGIYIHSSGITIYDSRSKYLDELNIYPKYKDGKEIKFLIDNKIQTFEETDVFCGYVDEYVEDIPKMVEFLRLKHKKICQLAEDLKSDIDIYNHNAPDGIPHIDYYNLSKFYGRIF